MCSLCLSLQPRQKPMTTGSSSLHLALPENYARSGGLSIRDWVGRGGGLAVGGENPFQVTELRPCWPALGLGLHNCFSFHLNPSLRPTVHISAHRKWSTLDVSLEPARERNSTTHPKGMDAQHVQAPLGSVSFRSTLRARAKRLIYFFLLSCKNSSWLHHEDVGS